MYKIIKNVIDSKNYDLREMLKKLDIFWAQGNISENERNELIIFAQSNANIVNGIDVLAKLEELDKRIRALEDAQTKVPENDTEEPEEVTYPEYTVGKWYYAGDKIAFEGANYICIAPDGQVCTWNPVEYPAYWELVVDENTESDIEED